MGDDRHVLRTIFKVRMNQAIVVLSYVLLCFLLDFFFVRRTTTNLVSTPKSDSNTDNSASKSDLIMDDLQNFADIKKSFVKTVDIPFIWHIPKSGGTSLKNMYSQCYNLVEASESGVANGNNNEPTLRIAVVEGGKYVNVDVTTEVGLKHASSLKLVESNIADLIVSPLLHPSASLFSSTRRGRIVSIFRDPVERVISLFFYLREATWEPTYEEKFKNMTLKEFAFSPNCESNYIGRSLLNKMEEPLTSEDVRNAKEILTTKVLVGLLSDMETSVNRFDQYFGFSSVDINCRNEYVKIGVNRHPHSDNIHDPEALEEIKRKNWLDIILFDLVKELFQKQGNLFQNITQNTVIIRNE